MNFRELIKVWVLYFLPIPGLPRLLSRWLPRPAGDEDCLLVQSYGRDALKDKGLTAFLSAVRRNAATNADAFAKLEELGVTPGQANAHMAKTVKRLMREKGITAICQWEVAHSLWLQDSSFTEENEQLVVIWPEPGQGYFKTRDVKNSSVNAMRKRGLSKPLEYSHPDMIARSLMILWRLGVSPRCFVERVPFAGFRTAQLWTWNWLLWTMYEGPCRVLHLVARWVALKPPTNPRTDKQ